MSTVIGKTRTQAREEAEEVVNGWATGAALTGWIPGSAFFLVAADMIMIRQVADAFGVGVFDEDAVKAHLGGLMGSAVGGSIAAELFGMIPVVGWAAKSVAMSGKAKLIGKAVIEYFEERSPLRA